jgi:hypothetical protein
VTFPPGYGPPPGFAPVVGYAPPPGYPLPPGWYAPPFGPPLPPFPPAFPPTARAPDDTGPPPPPGPTNSWVSGFSSFAPPAAPFQLVPLSSDYLIQHDRRLLAVDRRGRPAQLEPARGQVARDYAFDPYWADIGRGTARQMPTMPAFGLAVYSPNELELLPLRRRADAPGGSPPITVATAGAPGALGALAGGPAAAAAAVTTDPNAPQGIAQAAAATLQALGGAPAFPPSPGAAAGAGGTRLSVTTTVVVSEQGNETAMQQEHPDVPRSFLGPDQDNYLAGVVMSYALLTGLLPLSAALEEACRAFDIDEDTIAVTESQLETVLCNVTQKQQNSVRPMLFVFPLHDRYMSIPLRMFVYNDVVVDPITGLRRTLLGVDPFTWRHALPTGDHALRKRGEAIDTGSDEFRLRKRYHEFLVRLYSMIWRSLARLRAQATTVWSAEYARFVETTLARLRPAAQSVVVLEARIRALVARLQLLHGVMFNTQRFYQPAEALRHIMHPALLLTINRYLYFAASP